MYICFDKNCHHDLNHDEGLCENCLIYKYKTEKKILLSSILWFFIGIAMNLLMGNPLWIGLIIGLLLSSLQFTFSSIRYDLKVFRYFHKNQT